MLSGPSRPRYVPIPCQDSIECGLLILRDGSTAHLRPAAPEDRAALADFFYRLSPEALHRRFLSWTPPGPDLVDALCRGAGDPPTVTLLVTRTVEGEPRVIATGTYTPTDDRSVEVALAVGEAYHGRGLGTLLLERIALLAAGRGLSRLWAVAEPGNAPVLEVFRNSGFDTRERRDRGEVEVDLSVVATAATVERLEARDRLSDGPGGPRARLARGRRGGNRPHGRRPTPGPRGRGPDRRRRGGPGRPNSASRSR